MDQLEKTEQTETEELAPMVHRSEQSPPRCPASERKFGSNPWFSVASVISCSNPLNTWNPPKSERTSPAVIPLAWTRDGVPRMPPSARPKRRLMRNSGTLATITWASRILATILRSFERSCHCCGLEIQPPKTNPWQLKIWKHRPQTFT